MSDRTQPLLITGATGFVGSHLCEYLLSQGYTALHGTTTSIKTPTVNSGVTLHSVDLRDATAVTALLAKIKPHAIIHLASIATVGSSFEEAEYILTDNIRIQTALLKGIVAKAPHVRLLHISSADVYGVSKDETELPITEEHALRPVNPYAVSKLSQEFLTTAYARSYELDVVIARPFNHIGERQSEQFSVAAFAKQIIAIEQGRQSSLQVGLTSAVRDFTDVKDMVTAYTLLLERGTRGEVYNVGSGTGTSIQEIIEKLTALATVDVLVERDTARMRPLDIPISIADNKKIKALGWKPTILLPETLERILHWWRTHQ